MSLAFLPLQSMRLAKKLYGNKIPHWTALEVRRIIEYIKSITVEEDEKRLQVLRDIIAEVGYTKQDNEEVKRNVRRDLYNV